MKKNQLKGKLSFDKLTIAKLSNTSSIIGGESIYVDGPLSNGESCTCLTLTQIDPNTVIGRPTGGGTKTGGGTTPIEITDFCQVFG